MNTHNFNIWETGIAGDKLHRPDCIKVTLNRQQVLDVLAQLAGELQNDAQQEFYLTWCGRLTQVEADSSGDTGVAESVKPNFKVQSVPNTPVEQVTAEDLFGQDWRGQTVDDLIAALRFTYSDGSTKIRTLLSRWVKKNSYSRQITNKSTLERIVRVILLDPFGDAYSSANRADSTETVAQLFFCDPDLRSLTNQKAEWKPVGEINEITVADIFGDTWEEQGVPVLISYIRAVYPDTITRRRIVIGLHAIRNYIKDQDYPIRLSVVAEVLKSYPPVEVRNLGDGSRGAMNRLFGIDTNELQ